MEKPDFKSLLPKRSISTLDTPPINECPTCGGAEYVKHDIADVNHPEFGKPFACPTCKERQLVQDNIGKLVGKSGLDRSRVEIGGSPPKFFKNYQPRAGQEELYRVAKNFAANPEGWIFFSGTNGTGKTTLAQCIGNFVLDDGHSVLFRTAPELMDELRSSYEPGAPRSFQEIWNTVKDVELLILDELGRQHETGWVNEKMYTMFNRRWEDRTPTIVISNFDPNRLDRAIRSRLLDNSLVKRLDFGGGSGEY